MRRFFRWETISKSVVVSGLLVAMIATAAEPGKSINCVVLNDGRVFNGNVTEVAGGYRIEREDGYVVIPYEQIRVTSPNLPAAYEALRSGLAKPTTADHITLAEWCLENGLLLQARSEAAGALKLEPLRSDARALMTEIERQLAPDKQTPAPSSQLIKTPNGFVVRSDTTSSGLTRETNLEYIRKIQPLMLNTCGNASCHGSGSTNSFRLVNAKVGVGSFRVSSDANLDSILDRIDSQHPETSPLVTPLNETNPVHQRVFQGSTGAIQYQTLLNWVRQAASEGAGSYIATGSAARAPAPLPVQSAAAQPIELASREIPGPNSTVDNTPDGWLKEFPVPTLPDAFDPEEFNRRVHGMTAAELRSSTRQTAAPVAP